MTIHTARTSANTTLQNVYIDNVADVLSQSSSVSVLHTYENSVEKRNCFQLLKGEYSNITLIVDDVAMALKLNQYMGISVAIVEPDVDIRYIVGELSALNVNGNVFVGVNDNFVAYETIVLNDIQCVDCSSVVGLAGRLDYALYQAQLWNPNVNTLRKDNLYVQIHGRDETIKPSRCVSPFKTTVLTQSVRRKMQKN